MHTVDVTIDAGQWLGEQPHNWTYIGYDEINYTHTPEGETLLAKFGAFAEQPYYVRVHHLLCTGNSHGFYKWGSTNVYREKDGDPIYDWTTIDLVFDTLLQNNCKPFVELGFMPQHLADPDRYDITADTWTHHNYKAYGWACPPKDYDRWFDLIQGLVVHCLERYGADEVRTWYWELWNEPDLDYYWKGSIAEFNKLYDYTVAAVKSAYADARVGGPGTTNPDANGYSGEFLAAFLEHCVNGTNAYSGEQGTQLDFLSFHVKGGGYRADPLHEAQKPPSVKQIVDYVKTGYEIINGYPELTELECILSEIDPDGWAAGGAWDNVNLNFRNTPYYASFVADAFHKVTTFAQEHNWDVRLLSWAFMFVGERCFEGTRTFSTQGIDKAILNLFRMYAKTGHRAVSLVSDGAQNPLGYDDKWGMDAPSDVSGFATLRGDHELVVMIYNHHDDWDRQGEVEVALNVAHLPFSGQNIRLMHYRIDDEHSNAYAEWVRQGKPRYPIGGQYDAIKARDGLELYTSPQVVDSASGDVRIVFRLPVHGVSLLVLSEARNDVK
jgi:xylan 1,4-beta-xylosidase